MKEPNELEDVLDRALQAYLICQIRNKARGRLTKDLSQKYPDHFKRMPNGNFHWTGKSADEILEEYLSGMGYPKASRLWHQLCELLLRRAKRIPEVDYY